MILGNLGEFSTGLKDGVVSQGADLLEMILSPIETAKSLYSLIELLWEDPAQVGQALLDEMGSELEKIQSGDVHALGQFIGENLSPAAMLRVVQKVADFGRLARAGRQKSGTDNNTSDEAEQAYTCICCFVAGTPVLTAEGTTVIEALKVGDAVASRNMATGALEYKEVTATHFNGDKPTYALETGKVVVPPLSTAFHSDELLVLAERQVRSEFLDDAIGRALPDQKVISINGVELGRDLGRGYTRVSGAKSSLGKAGPPNKIEGLSKVNAVFKLDPKSGLWLTDTLYPVR